MSLKDDLSGEWKTCRCCKGTEVQVTFNGLTRICPCCQGTGYEKKKKQWDGIF
jgi:hypothetical protein